MKASYWKGFLSGAIVCAVFLSGTAVFASGGTWIEVFFRDIQFKIHGEAQQPSEGKSFIYEGVTYVPLRFIGEALGNNVGWNEETLTVTIGEDQGQKEQDKQARQLLEAGRKKAEKLQSLSIDMQTKFAVGGNSLISIGMTSLYNADIVRLPKEIKAGRVGVSFDGEPMRIPFYYRDRLYVKEDGWMEEEPTAAMLTDEINNPASLLAKLSATASSLRMQATPDGVDVYAEGAGKEWNDWVRVFFPDTDKPDVAALTVHKGKLAINLQPDTYLPRLVKADLEFSVDGEDPLSPTSLSVNLAYDKYDQHKDLAPPNDLDPQKIKGKS